MGEGRPWVRAVTLGGWPGLGASEVELALGERFTILVGRNGAGKSLLLSTLDQASDVATRTAQILPRALRQTGTFRFSCELQAGAQRFSYRYSREVTETDEDASVLSPDGVQIELGESCTDGVTGADIWRVEHGTLVVPGAAPLPIQAGVGLLGLLGLRQQAGAVPREARMLASLLGRVILVPAGVPRSDPSRRAHVFVTKGGASPLQSGRKGWRSPVNAKRIDRLATRLANAHDRDRTTFDEFKELTARLGLARNVSVEVYNDPRTDIPDQEKVDLAAVAFDDINIGLLSDGTLRVAEILLDLLRPAGSILLIEEPETAIHPGLLHRILSLLESYALDRQIVITTHSPIVVSWCRPEYLRLVLRESDATRTSALSEDEARRVSSYLNDEGTLGDFIFMQTSEQ
jgi:ABC-type lipoprotein export system ATPase subunit